MKQIAIAILASIIIGYMIGSFTIRTSEDGWCIHTRFFMVCSE